MIDKKTGYIELASDKVIKPFMSLFELRGMNLGESQTERNMENGWLWFNVRNLKVANDYLIISFGFLDDKLNQLNLVYSDLEFNLSKGWESWNEKGERQNAVIFNNWLKAELGSESAFAWGEVWAGYDDKGGSSSIGIRYKN